MHQLRRSSVKFIENTFAYVIIVLGEEFWLGLDNIYGLTQSKSYTLRFKFETFDGIIKTQYYTNFKLLDTVSVQLNI